MARFEQEERRNKYKKFNFADFVNRENEETEKPKKEAYQLPAHLQYKAGARTTKRKSELNLSEGQKGDMTGDISRGGNSMFDDQ